jgi:hypothetical protein
MSFYGHNLPYYLENADAWSHDDYNLHVDK